MHRRALPVAAFVVAVSLAVGAAAVAQDPATPATGDTATPAATRCAPAAGAGGTPGPVTGTPVARGECGTPGAGTPGAEDVAAVATTSVEIRFVDVAFIPAEVTIPADTDVTLTFVNEGVAVHNFKIGRPDIFSGYLGPGATTQVVVNLPAGTYAYVCTIPGHAQSGMSGILIAQE